MKPSHRRLRYPKPQPFFVRGRERPPVLTRPTSPPVYRPPLAVDPESGEIGWSSVCLEDDLRDLGLL